MKRVVDVYDTTFDGGHTHSVIVYDQPYRRWIAHTVFHAIESAVLRGVGIRLVDLLIPNRKKDPFFVPLSNRIELYCYDLGGKGKEVLYRADVDEETYAKLSRLGCVWT